MTDSYVAAVAYYAGRSQAMTREQVLNQFRDAFDEDGSSIKVSKHDDTVVTWYKRGYQDYVSEMEKAFRVEADSIYRYLIEEENNNG